MAQPPAMGIDAANPLDREKSGGAQMRVRFLGLASFYWQKFNMQMLQPRVRFLGSETFTGKSLYACKFII